MMNKETLSRDQQNAEPIKYELMVGLIASMLVGALVSIKTSLFGVLNRNVAAIGHSAGSSAASDAPTIANASTADGQLGGPA
ncbi:hypothetical protein [Methylobacterium sp. SI9]|uniref:hypothetical protein n=1 Tax=Methylobacterium guangdongense TaxID=3138811 RepID=UPI00313C2A77